MSDKQFEGLLTPIEALACRKSGYEGPWVDYNEDPPWLGDADMAGIIITEEDDPSLVWQEACFAPPLGHFLPMATAPRDGREVLLFGDDGISVCRWNDSGLEGVGWILLPGIAARPDFDFTGWAPGVTPARST